MAENNGKWTFWLVGFIATALLGGLMTLTSHVIANDKESRTRDSKICEELEAKNLQMYSVLSDIRIQLAEIRTDTAYLKASVKK